MKKINTIVKLVLELGPIVLFFVIYSRLKTETVVIAGSSYDGFLVATAAFIPLIIVSTGLLWWLSGTLSKMQLVTLVLVVAFGGLSLWLHDERFFKMKPTAIYALFAGALGFGLLRGRNYLASLMGEMLPMEPEGWTILTRRLVLFFAGLAVTNELVWRMMTTDDWVRFKTFVLPLALFGFFMGQGRLMARHAIEKNTD